ncbi:MAG: glycerol-3-phosphate acyltransferase [Elusimicrobia bacterium]|nr:glycerol-3-phosphate acyltransferase [Elusimicrobiota bacterium]
MKASIIALAATCYVSGGVPSGYLIAKRFGRIDIREHGSGNPGAANVYRVMGPAAGAATLVIDALKGFAPVLCARLVFPKDYSMMVLCGALAIVGHIFTVFLGFRGGKGVATSAGVFAALLPLPLIPAAAAFIIAAAASGHIAVGSIAASLALPISAGLLGSPKPLQALAWAVSILVLIRHIPNMRCLLKGERLTARGRGRPGTAP